MSDLDRLRRAYELGEPESRQQRDDTYGLRTNSPGIDRLSSAYGAAERVQQQQQGRDRPFYQRAFLGGVRGLAGALEPIQLAKDPFDAVVAGALDPETSITERMSRIEWANYIPFGEAPPRPSTGHEIMGLMGVENERAKRWGGVVFDLTADPLLAGAWLRLGAAATRSRSLARTGRKLDEAISLRGANQGLSKVVPGKRWVDRKAEETFDRFLNARVFWSKAEEPLTYGDYVMTRTAAASRQFPGSEIVSGEGWETVRDATGRWISRNRETGEVVQNFGREMWRNQAVARQEAREVSNRAIDLIEEAQSDVLGEDAVPFLQRAARIIGRGRAKAERAANGLPANVRDTIYAQGYDVADNLGIAARGMRAEAPSALKREFGEQVGRMTDDQERVLRQARSRVAKSAKDSGFDVDEAIRRFDTFTEKITEADALLGFHLSGYNQIKRLFNEEMARAGFSNLDEVTNMWTDMIQRGMGGEDVLSAQRLGGVDLEDAFSGMESVTGRKVSKLGDLLSPEVGMRGLNINDYLRNLREGHLRRSYGLFQSPTSFRNYVEQVRTGKVLPSNIIDQTHVRNAFAPDSPELDSFNRYMEGLGGIEGRGVVVRQSNLMEGIRDQLIERHGISRSQANRRAQESVGRLVKELQAGGENSPVSKLVDRVMELGAKYEQAPGQPVRAGLGQAMFRQRQDLQRETLEQLGELATPQISIRETARAARSQVAQADFMSNIYREARDRGYVTNGETFRKGTRFKPVQDTEEIYGPFAGKYVHPMLKKELHRAWRDRAAGGGGNFSKLRSLITGGYLASPNVITANLFGGVYTSALLGISPIRMFRELADSFKKFRRASKDVNFSFDELDDLKRWQGLDDQTLIDANIDEVLRRAGATRDMGPQGVQRVFDEVTRRFQGQLDAPLGQRWAGLEGFQFVENWMKVSAFKAQRRILARQRGVNMDEFTKAFADRSAAAKIIDKEASEVARVSVFDYCVDEATEALTDRGWLHVDDIDPERDRFLTRNIETNEVEWQYAKEIYVGPARPRTMRHMRSSRFDALVTPEHRWITQVKDGPSQMARTKHLTKHATLVASGGEYQAPTTPTYSDELVELVGWYVTEGANQTRGHSVQIAQSLAKNPEYVMQLRALADFYRAQGATVTEYQRDIGWGTICSFYFGKGVGLLLRETAPDKRLPMEFLTALTTSQLELLFTTLMAADGFTTKHGTMIYTQQDEGRLDDFEVLAALLGYRTGRRPTQSAGCEAVTVYRTTHVDHDNLQKEDVPYEGRVWCPVTPNGTWFARRNGTTYWTGNTDIPESIRLLRDSGLILFPSFPYFLTARTARAAFERPGVLAVSDRLSNAVNNAQMDEDTKRGVFASMPEWLQDEQGTVMPFRTWTDEDGNTRRSVIPFNQLIPTATLMGNPWGESLSSVGIYKPFVEVGSAAFITKDGEAPFSAQYGQRVYEQGLPAGSQTAQAMGFLANSLAPGILRKLSGYTPGEGFHGILPTLREQALPMDGPLADSIYNVWEVENKRAQRRLWDEAVAATVRSPQVITMEGPLANIRKNIAASQFELEEETRALSNRRDRALMRGNRQLAEQLQRRIDRKRREWAMRLRPALEAVREGTE